MRAPLLLLGGIVVLSITVARALSCVCSPLECDVLTDEDCPGGLTWDPCRCCKVCARVEGEPCGGLFGFSGSCAVGLQCVIKNLLPHTREVDEGVCTKIPGRWRRHCPNGPLMSGPGCNLVGDEGFSETGSALATGKCVCGPSVPWCPGEPRPYVYMTRHECKLNLAAKIAYDDLINSEDKMGADVDVFAVPGTHPNRIFRGPVCPDDSELDHDGNCKCASPCPAIPKCEQDQHPVQTKPASPETPGSCCPRYKCISDSGHRIIPEHCPEDTVPTNDGRCKCVLKCPVPICSPGQRPDQIRAAVPETLGSCCPLYKCVPLESVSLVKTDDGNTSRNCLRYGMVKKKGDRWKEELCTNCECVENGEVFCHTTLCRSCENPIPAKPDECCSHCPQPTIINTTSIESDESCPTNLADCNLKCDYGYATDKYGCPICKCAKEKSDDIDIVSIPLEEDKICPELPCKLNCDLIKDANGCSVCACQPPSSPTNVSGDVFVDERKYKKFCPELRCDLHCERGLLMDENDCTLCECKPPREGCPPLVGCKKQCQFGYRTNKRGCPVCRCRSTCLNHRKQEVPEGSAWHYNVCTTCTCESGGRINCKETICSNACNNSLPPDPYTCCPTCPITIVKNDDTSSHHGTKGWGVVPITLITVLTLLCLLLIVHIVRSRFRARLSPTAAAYSSYPSQYYKCVPAYDTPEKIVPL